MNGKNSQEPNNRNIIALNAMAMGQHGIILLLVGPLVPSLMRQFGITEASTGLLLSMGAVGFMFGPLLAGAVIDRFTVRWAFIVGCVIEVVFLILFGLSPLFFLAVAANFLVHLGAAFIETGANVLPTLIPSKRSAHSMMNLVHLFFSVGAFITPFLIGLYREAVGEWRPVMFFALVPTGILLAWTLGSRFPGRRTTHESPFAHVGTVVRSRTAMFGALSLLLYVGAEVGLNNWLVHYMEKTLGFGPAAASNALSIMWVFIMIGRYLNSVLGNHLSSRFLVTASSLGGAAGVLGFLLVDQLIPAYAFSAWIGLCLSGVFPNVMGELNNRDPERAGTVTAIMAMGAATGAAVFPGLMGVIAELTSMRAAFLTPAILQVLVIGSFAVALAPGRSARTDAGGR